MFTDIKDHYEKLTRLSNGSVGVCLHIFCNILISLIQLHKLLKCKQLNML